MNIREKREAAVISQAELARRIGMHQSKLSKIENGHIQPSVGDEVLIEAALNAEWEHVTEPPSVIGVESEPDSVPQCQPYPSAPTGIEERKAWVAERSRAMERGFPSPESGIFGGVKKQRP